MTKFFQMIQSVADADKRQFNSIKDLTIEIAMKAGYKRQEHACKNGNIHVRTTYDKPFDSGLVAKWLMYYKKLFVSKLGRHPEFKDFYSQIIYRTFECTMKAFVLEKTIDDKLIHKVVNMSLANRIGEVLYEIGSSARLEKYNEAHKDGVKEKGYINKLKLKTSMIHMSSSLEQMFEDENYQPSCVDKDLSDIIVDLRMKLSDNPMGARVLEAMLNCDKKIQPSHIDDFVYMKKEECTDANKVNIVNAWRTIEDTLKNYLHQDNDLNDNLKWGKMKKVSYSFEKKLNGGKA